MVDSARILVVEDDAKHGAMCARLLERRGYQARSITSAREALSLLAQNGDIDLVLADLQMPEMDGIQLLSAVKGKYPHIEFIVMTGYGTVKSAVEAMQLGAAHYIQKPFDHDELNLLIQRALEKKQLEEKVDRLRAELQGKYSFENVIGKSQVMQAVLEKWPRLAAIARQCSSPAKAGPARNWLHAAFTTIHSAGGNRPATQRFPPVAGRWARR